MFRTLIALFCLSLPLQADGERSGDFDYYVMALSWTPNWCAHEGDRKGSPQCDENQGLGFTLHGLWPQYEQGWPAHCTTTAANPSRSITNAMADIMGTSGLAWYQWKKHGRCSGLDAAAYFERSRQAYDSIARPEILRKVSKQLVLPAQVIEQAFLEANPALEADQITITCKSGRIQEARICLTKDLLLRRCGQDVIQDCSLSNAEFNPMR
jgi:ribonuclease T2